MRRRGSYFWEFVFCLCCSSALAADELVLDDVSENENIVAVYGASCEKIKDGEAKSSVRVRATDKASFDAVSSLSELAEIKKEKNEHDFNVLVYDLVDNYVEDLAVRTTKQDDTQLCVEVTGYLNKDNINGILDIRQDETAEPQVETLPTAEIADPQAETNPSEPEQTADVQTAADNPSVAELVVTEEDNTSAAVPETETASDNRIKIYVAPTVFFNETESDIHTKSIKNVLQRELDFKLGDKNDADFIIKSNVLRAKIDPINSSTNRLQMVVSITAENLADKTSVTEHQNRFVLFSSGDDEQRVAGTLMRKLFGKATETIIPRLKKKNVSETERQTSPLPQMITPAKN